jgi:hypothetical protein
VTAVPELGETYAEVAHEAIFRRWDKLRLWIAVTVVVPSTFGKKTRPGAALSGDILFRRPPFPGFMDE